MLFSLLKKIRRQPKARRDGIALGIASTFTSVVAIIWLINMPGNISGSLSRENLENEQTTGLFEKISEQTAAVKDAISGESSPQESLSELMQEYKTKTVTSDAELSEGIVSGDADVVTTATTSATTTKEVRIKIVPTAATTATSSRE